MHKIVIFCLMICPVFLMSGSCYRRSNPVLLVQNSGKKNFSCEIYQYKADRKVLKFRKEFHGQVYMSTFPPEKIPDRLCVYDVDSRLYIIRVSLSKGTLFEFVVTSKQDTIVRTIDISAPHKCDTIIIHNAD